jgi:NAD(P)-dependent dehydrogenase (short-subunit alcohol dehydrogenase family)
MASPDPFRYDGRTVLVTGGGSGIGRAIAGCFVARGASVVVIGRREAPLRETAAALGERAHFRVQDVGDLDSLPGLVADIEREIGPIDTLVNNAGINHKIASTEVSDDAFEQVLLTNLRGAFALTRACAGPMAERGRGDIQMITSMTAYFGLEKVAAYTASKAALQGLVHQLAVEWGPLGLRVNGIAPGFILTEMSRMALDQDPARLAKVLARTPLGRRGEPEAVGWASVFLASPAASFISGTVLPVDGGAAVGF